MLQILTVRVKVSLAVATARELEQVKWVVSVDERHSRKSKKNKKHKKQKHKKR